MDNRKKVLILSDDYDQTTNDVIGWLIKKNIDYVRVNPSKFIEITKIDICNENIDICLKYDGQVVNLNEFTHYWYRRGNFTLHDNADSLIKANYEKLFLKEIIDEIKDQNRTIIDFLHLHISNSTSLIDIGSYISNNTNKLYNLLIAQKVGLKIPKSVVTSKKSELQNFKGLNDIITKPLTQGASWGYQSRIVGYTKIVNDDFINKLPELFKESFFQECLQKEFEIRVFYLKEKMFASVILSQNDLQTEVDFRNYNYKKPNRVLRFELPSIIEKGIINLMKSLYMQSGSLDFVYTKSKEYIFLEVNPVGQFFQVSHPCRYQLEKEVAKIISN